MTTPDAPIFSTIAKAAGSVGPRERRSRHREGRLHPIARSITRSVMPLMAVRRRLTGCARSKPWPRSSAAVAAAILSGLRGDF